MVSERFIFFIVFWYLWDRLVLTNSSGCGIKVTGTFRTDYLGELH